MSGSDSDLGFDFLNSLIKNGVERLEPKISPEGILYDNIEYDESDWKTKNKQLEKLANQGYLKPEDFSRAILCPSCDSPHVYSKYACPTDRSIFVRKVRLLRHKHDGYQGEFDEFEKDGRIICPHCQQDLGDAEDDTTWDKTLREIGYSFECVENGHRFEKPLVLHHCVVCDSMFDYKTARYITLYAYTLTKKAYQEVSKSTEMEHLVEPVIDYLREKDLEIRWGFELKGSSGSVHEFDLAALQKISILVMDYSFGDSDKLVSLLGKKMDIPGVEAALIDFSDNEELFNLGKVYNIPIIDTGKEDWTKTLDEIIEKMKKDLEEKNARKLRKLLERRA